MIDTHAHLNTPPLVDNLDETIRNAVEAGVESIIVPGLDIESSTRAVKIAHTFPHIFATVGIYPGVVADAVLEEKSPDQLQGLVPLLDDPMVVAVGEIGLDWYLCKRIEKEYPQMVHKVWEAQHWYFVTQFILAAQHNLACVIHNRWATESILSILKEHVISAHRGKVVLHCCEGDLRLLTLAEEYDFYIGVDGDVTFDDKKQQFIRQVPLDRLVLETDSPYLTPEPYKSQKQKNQPSFLPAIAQKVAELHGTTIEEISEVTSTNAITLFGKSLVDTQ